MNPTFMAMFVLNQMFVAAFLTGWTALIASGTGVTRLEPLKATEPEPEAAEREPEAVTRWGCPRKLPKVHRCSS
jgi:hypothetical protein